MPPLVDGQWRLVYPGIDLVFGDGRPYLITAPPELGVADPAVQDQAYPGGDGTMFGRDYRPGQTIAFELGVNCYDETEGMDAHAVLERAWRGDALRTTPGAVAELHVRRGGRERVCYGRPRRFASVLAQVPALGYSGATCDFACSDDLFYDAAGSQVTVSLVPPPAGGLVAPLAAPLSTVPVVNRPGLVTTGGLVATWPVITIRGPVTSPAVQLTGLWTLALDVTLAYDQDVTIDTRPWVRTVLRTDGATLAGKLTKASAPLSEARIPPQTSTEVVYRGVDITGTSSATVAWQDAYPHL